MFAARSVDMSGRRRLGVCCRGTVVLNVPKKNAKRANNSHKFALTKEWVAALTLKCTKNNRVVQNLHQDTFVSKYAL